MSTSVRTPLRRAVSALATVTLALTGLLVATAPATAAGAERLIDDFVAPSPGNRSVEAMGASVSEDSSGTHVSITPGGGSRYAQFTWTFATPVDLTANGVRQLQLTYSDAHGTDSAGTTLSNPIMMAMYVTDADGHDRSRGGTGVIDGSGTFVTNFYPQSPDDVRFLQGDGDLTRVRSIRLWVGTAGNRDTASITLGKYAAVEAEEVYSLPQFSGPTVVTVPLPADPAAPGGSNQVDATVTATGYPPPSVTLSGTVPPGVTATTTGSSVAFSGVPTQVGTWPVTLEAQTAQWLRTQHTVTFRTHVPPTISGDGTMDAVVGQAATHALTVTGAPDLTASFEPPLPAGLSGSISGSTLTISGTPTGAGGVVSTQATVSTPYASASLPLTIEVSAPPTIGAVADQLVGVGAPLTPISVPTTGYPAPTLSATGLPPGVTATATATGAVVTGTPTSAGVFPVTLTAANGVGTAATASFTLTVGSAPELTVTPSVVASVGEDVDEQVVVIGLPAATVTATGLPDGVSVVADGDDWALRGTPTRASMGTSTATVTATNPIGGDTADVEFTVLGAPEVADPAPVEATVGVAVDVTVAATGYPVPALTATNLPAGLTATDDGAGHLRVQGAPTTSGTWAVEVTATNTEDTDTATLSIEVGTAPVFDDGDTLTLTVREGTAMSHLLPVSAYPSHTVALVGGALPEGLVLASDGTLSGTPATGAATVGDGTYSAVVQAANRSGSDELTLTVSVLSPPTASLPTTVSVAADSLEAVTFDVGGRDLPTVTMTGLPPGLVLSQVDEDTWQLSGTVARADRGPYDATLTLENAFGRSSRIVRVEVTAPLVWDPAQTEVVVETGVRMAPLTLSATGYPMPTGYWLTDWPSWLGWDPPTWGDTAFSVDFVGTPPVSHTQALTLTPADPGPSITVVIRAVERPVIDAPATLDVLADEAVDEVVTVYGTPAAGLTATGLPAGLTLDASTAPGEWRIHGIPTRAGAGVHAVTLTADNGIAVTHSLTVTVGAAPVAPTPTWDMTWELGTQWGIGLLYRGYPMPTIEITGPPPGMDAWVDADGWAHIEGTPSRTGEFTTVFTATNAHGTAQTVVTVQVQQAPTFADDDLELVLVEGVADTVPLPLVGFPYPSVTLTGEVPGMALTSTPGGGPVLSGTPAPGSAGSYTLDVTATNTVRGTARQDVLRVRVRVDARAAITAGTDPVTAAVGTPFDHLVTVAGSPLPTMTATGLPDGLTLEAGATPGEFRISGTPAVGSGGRHTAHLVAENGVLDAAIADVAVEVTEPVRLAVGGDGRAALREGTATRVGVATSGGWPTTVTLRVEGTLPAGLTFVDDGDGTGHVVGTPTAGTAGRWSVVVVADNGAAVTRAPLVLDVAAAPAPVRPATRGTGSGAGGTTTATVPSSPAGDDPASGATDDGADDGTSAGSDEGTDDDAAGADDDAQGAPPVVDPEETIRTEPGPRPWWWILGAALIGAVLLGLRTLERKVRSL